VKVEIAGPDVSFDAARRIGHEQARHGAAHDREVLPSECATE